MLNGYEYEVYDGETYYASAWNAESDGAAFGEAMHYASQCDRPFVYRVVKNLVASPDA